MTLELPPPYSGSLLTQIREVLLKSGRKIIVLDDDPTGTQTVHGVGVLTHWSVDSLVTVLRDPNPVTYILTNTRSLPHAQASARTLEIASNLKAAYAVVNRPFEVVSRGDSTLRGHFPLEVEALSAGLELNPDGILLIPFFGEGGRYTIGDIHYVADGDTLVPVAQTEYARDQYFGYTKSNLREWIIEKSHGTEPNIMSISIEDIRVRGVNFIRQQLLTAQNSIYIVVNAADYRDLEVFTVALLHVVDEGKRFVTRSAASYVRVLGGIEPQPLLTRTTLISPQQHGQPGLVIAGSYIEKSTLQIQAVCQLPGIKAVEISVRHLLDSALYDDEIRKAVQDVDGTLDGGQDVILYTSRELVTGDTQDHSLNIGQIVSNALVEIVASITVRPGWIIAKGGITSSDIATKALQIQYAEVLGQVLPGVPVWRSGDESRFPDLTYVVFPGNVGSVSAIADIVTKLRSNTQINLTSD